MFVLRTLNLLMVLMLLQACSWEGAKRTTYETVESLRVQQCLDHPDDAECTTQRQRYDQYESKRRLFNLESAVGQGEVCACGGVGQDATTRDSPLFHGVATPPCAATSVQFTL